MLFVPFAAERTVVFSLQAVVLPIVVVGRRPVVVVVVAVVVA